LTAGASRRRQVRTNLSGVRPDALVAVERRDRPHVLPRELEVEHVDVLLDAPWRYRLGYHDVAEL
jgi:hypothetical protein